MWVYVCMNEEATFNISLSKRLQMDSTLFSSFTFSHRAQPLDVPDGHSQIDFPNQLIIYQEGIEYYLGAMDRHKAD